MFKIKNHIDLMIDFISNTKNPNILEFGVERGSSTKKFIKFAEDNSGKVFSVDVDNCKKISDSKNWKFLQSDDLEIDYVLKEFKEIREHGADIIYIDSYHEDKHVQKLLSLYFKYLKKDGAIFVDDVDSHPFRKKKDIWNSIVYDLTIDAVKEFYYNNSEFCSLRIFYDENENGLAMIYKHSDFGSSAKEVKYLWNYNIFFKIFYPYLRKISKFFKILRLK
jgi:predicted O-methyltransferase YrrM